MLAYVTSVSCTFCVIYFLKLLEINDNQTSISLHYEVCVWYTCRWGHKLVLFGHTGCQSMWAVSKCSLDWGHILNVGWTCGYKDIHCRCCLCRCCKKKNRNSLNNRRLAKELLHPCYKIVVECCVVIVLLTTSSRCEKILISKRKV